MIEPKKLSTGKIRSRRVDLPAIAGYSPLHTSVRTSLTHTRLPQDCTFVIGIECVHNS